MTGDTHLCVGRLALLSPTQNARQGPLWFFGSMCFFFYSQIRREKCGRRFRLTGRFNCLVGSSADERYPAKFRRDAIRARVCERLPRRSRGGDQPRDAPSG